VAAYRNAATALQAGKWLESSAALLLRWPNLSAESSTGQALVVNVRFPPIADIVTLCENARA
jgi:hypothetical protein